MELPSLDTVIEQLQALAEVDTIDPDAKVTELGVDSLDLLEWSYTIEDEYGVDIQDAVMDAIEPDDTLRSVYEKVMAVLAEKLAAKA